MNVSSARFGAITRYVQAKIGAGGCSGGGFSAPENRMNFAASRVCGTVFFVRGAEQAFHPRWYVRPNSGPRDTWCGTVGSRPAARKEGRGVRECRELEARAGIEPAIEVLQTSALPLGYRAPSTVVSRQLTTRRGARQLTTVTIGNEPSPDGEGRGNPGAGDGI